MPDEEIVFVGSHKHWFSSFSGERVSSHQSDRQSNAAARTCTRLFLFLSHRRLLGFESYSVLQAKEGFDVQTERVFAARLNLEEYTGKNACGVI